MKLVEAARLRMEDAKRKLEGKTVVLENLGKARGFVDFVLGMGDFVAAVRVLNALVLHYSLLPLAPSCSFGHLEGG